MDIENLLTIEQYGEETTLKDKHGRERKGTSTSWIYKAIKYHIISEGRVKAPFEFTTIAARHFIYRDGTGPEATANKAGNDASGE